MVCGICAKRVTAALNNLDEVESASCDLERAKAEVVLNAPVDEAVLRQAVLDAAIAQPLRLATERAARAVGL
jgi:copper chaperone CopZ